jgi:hypothetical protein
MTILASLPGSVNSTDGDLDTTDHGKLFAPSTVEESFYLAFTLGLDGEDPATPAEFPSDGSGPVNRAFLAGLAAGRYTLQRERDRIMGQWAADAQFEAWVDAMDAMYGHTLNGPFSDDDRSGAIGLNLPYED